MLTDYEIDTIADRVALRLRADAPGVALRRVLDVPRRMNVVLFGVCVNRSPHRVKCKIRSRFIDPRHVEGGGRGSEILIDREALAKFHVTPEVAAERLLAWQRQQTPPAAIPAPVPHSFPA